jgi:hypothetical protein
MHTCNLSLEYKMIEVFIEVVLRYFHIGSLLEGLSLLSSQLWLNHIGYDDLHGSDRQSVTPYVHGICVYYVVQR